MRVFNFRYLSVPWIKWKKKARNVVTRLVGENRKKARKVLFVPLNLIDLIETGLASFINTLMRSFMYRPQRSLKCQTKRNYLFTRPVGQIGSSIRSKFTKQKAFCGTHWVDWEVSSVIARLGHWLNQTRQPNRKPSRQGRTGPRVGRFNLPFPVHEWCV